MKHPFPAARMAWRPLALAVHIGLAAASMAVYTPQAIAQSSLVQASIPAGSLSDALSRFALQANVSLAVDASKLQGLTSVGLQGAVRVEEGFARLLAGSGYQLAANGNGFVLVPAAKPVVTPAAPTARPVSQPAATTLEKVVVTASADASATGVIKAYAGGQVARGARAGLLGNKDMLDTPFAITAYTSELIQDQQARSVGDVLQNDPSVRVARGFGNFQESYFIRGYLLNSDSVAYNGLYGLLPRQYISASLFERVEVLKGASAFLNGASPDGDAIGGSINLLPKRAANSDLTRLSTGYSSGNQRQLALDVSRRFGEDKEQGLRLNLARRDGGTAIDGEDAELSLASLGWDWRGENARLSADIGFQEHKLKGTRTNVTLGSGLTSVPVAPDAESNWAQPWSYSNERDVFGTVRGELDIKPELTAWAAAGFRQSEEANSLANLTVTSLSGAANTSRFDNTREDDVQTYEAGLRGKATTGAIGHEWVLSANYYQLEKRNAYAWDYFNTLSTNLYQPVAGEQRAFSTSAFRGNNLASPALTGRSTLKSVAVGDTLSLLDQRVLLTLGVRHQQLDLLNLNYNTGTVSSHYDQDRLSPLAGLVVKVLPGLSLYGNYVEGLSQGGTAPTTAANSGQMLSPYVSKQQELGVKYDLGKLALGAAYFHTVKPRGVTNAANVYAADGEERHQGLELTAFGQPAKGVRVLGGITLLDTELRQTGSASSEGKHSIGVPALQANLGLELDVASVSGLSLDARVVHTGKMYANEANTLSVPGWTRVDLGARYLTEIGGQLVTLRGRVDNVANRNYWASSGGYPGNGYLVLGAPRTVSVNASVDF